MRDSTRHPNRLQTYDTKDNIPCDWPRSGGAFLRGIPLWTLVTEPLANGQTTSLPGLDGTAQIALTSAIDLAHSTISSKIDDHVAFAGMEADPDQETDKPIIVAA